MTYVMLSSRALVRLRRQLDKIFRAGGEQYERWNAVSALYDAVPRPHMRPVRQAQREIRQHYSPP